MTDKESSSSKRASGQERPLESAGNVSAASTSDSGPIKSRSSSYSRQSTGESRISEETTKSKDTGSGALPSRKASVPKSGGSAVDSNKNKDIASRDKSLLPAQSHNRGLRSREYIYDSNEADLSLRIGPIVQDKRFWRVARTLTTFVAGSLSDKYGKDAILSSTEKQRRRAKRVTKTLLELGPTFIKLGQFLSARRDILTEEMAEELAELQDRVPQFDAAEARAIIERDLGSDPSLLFSSFEDTVIASASIGQVHRAKLKDGTPVVVKVQRPGLASQFYQDLGYMRMVVRMGMALRPSGEWDSWLKLSDEFGKTLFSELDYLQEGRNADRLRQILKDHDEVRVPRVFWKYTGKRVLTLEYIPGTKVDNVEALRASGLDLVEIGNRLVSCFLDQVLLHGFFHADPHAGNLAIDEWGNVIIYDYGMISEISEAQRDAITGCIASVIKQDTDELVNHLKVLQIVKENADPGPVKRTLAPFIEYYSGKRITDLDFSHLENDIDRVTDERAVQLPPNLAYLLRAGTSIEGIARTLHPNFSFVDAAKPALRKWILQRPDQAARILKIIGGDYNQIIKAIKMAWQKFIRSRKDSEQNLPEAAERIRLSAAGPGPQDPKILETSSRKEVSSARSHVNTLLSSAASTHQKVPALPAEAVPPKTKEEQLVDDQDIKTIKERLNDLEKQVEQVERNRVNLLSDSLWLLSFSLMFTGASLLPDFKGIAPYFLIGNVVMVAKLIRNASESSKVRDRSANLNSTRRQRR